MAAVAAPQHSGRVIPFPRRPFAAVAAAVLLIAGGLSLPPLLDDNQQAQNAASGEEAMHEIMGASDVVSANLDASGASLSIVSSTSMDKAGAMVDGEPALADGMGAQVWSVDDQGELTSAGVIGQDPHEDVWMPFDSHGSQVIVTEEPAAGSTQPTGRVLAQVRL
ncbi:anti-sigma factor [Corynebacterium vitaeruminis]|uniref:Anti-sigma-K factor n=1 Tax=Corynebacterium vitaeruminis DSM 20294 TaxID=1224164 RepID=W5Y3E9_9CORY|nr:anti-sigma factor [Corynebacterium vitaeruminis]AHI23360.1 anti-sigma-K factor [Corynebacterium vitaeruminis DSM 20294]